jgi:hypothetical protein
MSEIEPPKPSPETKQKKQNFISFCIGLYLGSLTTALIIFDDKRMHPKRPAGTFPALLPTKKNLKLGALIPFFWSAGIVLGLVSLIPWLEYGGERSC